VDILAPVALLAAVAAAIGAGFLMWSGQGASRSGRGALFNTERQVAYERAKRSRYSALALGALSIFLFVVYFVTSGSSGIVLEPTPAPTRTPRPTATMAPEIRATMIATLEPAPTPTPPNAKAVVVNTELGLRLRETPGGTDIDFLPDGTVVEVLPEPQVKTDDGITWQKVQDPQGRIGWVATDYIVIQ
jgi:Bacterial SH3 domain